MAKTDTSPVRERSFEEGRELLDRQASLRLGISGEEFLRAWEAGEFGDRDDSDLMGVAMMLPFVR